MFGLLYRKETAHEESVWTSSWSHVDADGQDYILTGSLDNTVKIWQWQNNDMREVHCLEGYHHLGVISVDSHASGSVAVSSGIDCSICAWDIPSGSTIWGIRSGGGIMDPPIVDAGPVDSWTVALSPDSRLIATGTHSGKISLYNIETKEKETVLDTGGKFMLAVAFSPDGRFLAGASMEGIIYIFDLKSTALLHTMEGHAMPIRSLVFSADGNLIISGSDDKYMKIHDLTGSSSLVGTLPGHSSFVLSVAISPDGKYLASGSADHTVRIWDMDQRQQLHTFSEHTDQVWSVKFNPVGDRLVSVSDDKSVAVYSIPA